MEIEPIIELSRLSLKAQEKGKLKKDLESILAYVDELKQVPTEGIEPTSHVLDIQNVFRQDKAVSCNVREEVIKHAPRREGNFFRVPKVIDQE